MIEISGKYCQRFTPRSSYLISWYQCHMSHPLQKKHNLFLHILHVHTFSTPSQASPRVRHLKKTTFFRRFFGSSGAVCAVLSAKVAPLSSATKRRPKAARSWLPRWRNGWPADGWWNPARHSPAEGKVVVAIPSWQDFFKHPKFFGFFFPSTVAVEWFFFYVFFFFRQIIFWGMVFCWYVWILCYIHIANG